MTAKKEIIEQGFLAAKKEREGEKSKKCRFRTFFSGRNRCKRLEWNQRFSLFSRVSDITCYMLPCESERHMLNRRTYSVVVVLWWTGTFDQAVQSVCSAGECTLVTDRLMSHRVSEVRYLTFPSFFSFFLLSTFHSSRFLPSVSQSLISQTTSDETHLVFSGEKRVYMCG